MNNMQALNTVSYDQYVDIPSLGNHSKVIFSENVYNQINRLIGETQQNNSEVGCYLVGRKAISSDGELCFYFDDCTSQFQTTDGNFANGGVVPTNGNKYELLEKLEQYNASGVQACIMHFHVHNLKGLYQSFSDQDYGVYATMKHQLKCETFGMLAAPNRSTGNGTTELSIVNCRNPKVVGTRPCANFYLIPNLYYCQGNQIYKVGSFQKNGLNSKTISTEFARPDRFVQNYREWPGANVVSGIGINPNTKSMIHDEIVGYMDVNERVNFPDENLTLEFPNLNTESSISYS